MNKIILALAVFAAIAPAQTPFYTVTKSGNFGASIQSMAVDNNSTEKFYTLSRNGVVLTGYPPFYGGTAGVGSTGGFFGNTLNATAASRSIAADSVGDIFVADSQTAGVYRSSGMGGPPITPIAGNGSKAGSHLDGIATSNSVDPLGIAVDPIGINVYIIDLSTAGYTIKEISSGRIRTLPFSPPAGAVITSIAVDGADNVYFVVLNVSGSLVYMCTARCVNTQPVAIAGGGTNTGGGPSNAEYFGTPIIAVNTFGSATDHGVYLADSTLHQIYRIDFANQATSGTVTAIVNVAAEPRAITVDASGIVFFGDVNGDVWQLDPSVPITTVAASLPLNFNDGTLTPMSVLDTRVTPVSGATGPALQTLPFVGVMTTVNGYISTTGPQYAAPAGYPWVERDTARNVVLMHPNFNGSVSQAADMSYCPNAGGSFQLQGAFARANDSLAGTGVQVMIFKNFLTQPQFTASIAPSAVVNPGDYFGGPAAAPFNFTVSTIHGDCLHFAVFPQNDGGFDATALQFTATTVPVLTTLRQVTVTTNPPGLQITVDGNTYTSPHSFSFVSGGSHTIGTTASQTTSVGKYSFASWSDGNAGAAPAVHWLPAQGTSPYPITATFNVQATGPPVINSFKASSSSIPAGQTTTLQWDVTGATSLSVDQGVGVVTGSNGVVVKPGSTTTYTLTATGNGQTVKATTTVTVIQGNPPQITSFTATPANIQSGQSSTLRWTATNATGFSIDQGVGVVTGTSVAVSPKSTTTYTLTAAGNGTATAQTTVTVGTAPPPSATLSVLNGASFVTPISPGSFISIFGAGMAASTNTDFGLPLPPNFGGTAATVNGATCPLVYVSPSQINCQVPVEASLGTANVAVTYSGKTWNGTVQITSAAPGIFCSDSQSTVAIVQDAFGHNLNNQVTAGQVVVMYLTGIGPVSPSVQTGQPALGGNQVSKATLTPVVTVGGMNAEVLFLGLSPGYSGLGQMNLIIPPNAATNSASPLIVTLNGVASKTVTLNVQGNGPATSSVSPGQLLSIPGSFSTSSNVLTNIVFSDKAGYKVTVPAASVTAGSVTVPVPIYLRPSDLTVRAGAVTATVTQGATSSPAVNLTIGSLPATGVTAGKLTLAFLNNLAQLAGTANQSWQRIGQPKGLDVSVLGLAAQQSNLNQAISQLRPLVSGLVSQLSMGAIGGRSVYLDTNSLALLDQSLYAFVTGAVSPPATISRQGVVSPRTRRARPLDETSIIDDFIAELNQMLTQTLPQGIQSNAQLINSVASAALGSATLGAILFTSLPADAAILAGGVAGAGVWAAVTWASAAISATLQGGAALINSPSATQQNFDSTIGFIRNTSFLQLLSQLISYLSSMIGPTAQILDTAAQTLYNAASAAGTVANRVDSGWSCYHTSGGGACGVP